MKRRKQEKSLVAAVCYFGLYLLITISLLVRQPFGSPPDENNRYLIPAYIAEHGTLPNGYDPEIRIDSYGFSYAFQPILPYIIQGYAMRLAGIFTDSQDVMLYTARSVNLLFGLVMAVFVMLLGQKWFSDRRLAWLFSFLVTFLPQAIFMHTYVNTDSCCLLSIAIILYALTCGLREGFRLSSSLLLAAGIILCALSYYNAYGYILSSILLFVAFYMRREKGKASFDGRSFLKWGSLIAAVVLVGIGWWFIRSAVLYDGDFLGLKAREDCAALYAVPGWSPETRVTWQNRGYSVWEMLRETTFLELSRMSFIGIFGAMSIPLSPWIYRFYRALFFGGVLLCVLIPRRKCGKLTGLLPGRKGLEVFFHANLIFCMWMPLFLSIQYSYTTDYQPQGRYLLPALLPLAYYTVRGMEKGFYNDVWERLSRRFGKDLSLVRNRLLSAVVLCLCLLAAGCILWAVFGSVYPYYAQNPGAL